LFDWTGTQDPSPWLCIPDALRVMADLVPGGWKRIQQQNHALALQARDMLCATLGIAAPAPDSMLGALASVPLPPRLAADLDAAGLYAKLVERGFETLVMPWPLGPGGRVLRVSAQLYNTLDDYRRLAKVLGELLAA
jgi:isopenicillin-N epimerase